ncbi:MAG: GLUG motif-containing protein, partial [Dysgonamonadaceae bacterium]|nr:GLUG motif-containing protein [Dysgonamonadaceae bacterium]
TYSTGEGWIPIGSSDLQPFKGRYDGQKHEIQNLTINRPDAEEQGLFGYITFGSVLENISLITVKVEGNKYVGGLVGYFNNGTITSCNVVGTVNGKDYVGGLVGRQSFGTITSSYTSGTVNGTDIVGGLVGSVDSNPEVKVTNSYSLASVTVTTNGRVGGLVGLNQKAIENCYAAGKVTGSGTNAGGLVGENKGAINSSYYDSEKTGQSDEGKGVGKPTDEMQTETPFTGWDEAIWKFVVGNYPTLR